MWLWQQTTRSWVTESASLFQEQRGTPIEERRVHVGYTKTPDRII